MGGTLAGHGRTWAGHGGTWAGPSQALALKKSSSFFSAAHVALNCFFRLVAMARRPTPLTLPSTDEEDVIFQQEASWHFFSFTLFL